VWLQSTDRLSRPAAGNAHQTDAATGWFAVCSICSAEDDGTLQGLMQALQDQGILMAVFDQLDDVSDMMRCATVSKAWRQASNNARPSRLCISWVEAQGSQQTEGQDTPPSAALSAVQKWLKHKHARGAFQRVQDLSISIKPSFTQGVSLCELVLCESPLCNFSLHRFWQELLNSAEGWPVQSCNLESANESLESTVKLLPKTVRHLELCIGRLTETIYLSLFDRFPYLQSVELRSTNRHFRSTFILDRSAFTLVQKELLYIEPFKVSRTCSVAACQRRYTQVAPHIYTFTDL